MKTFKQLLESLHLLENLEPKLKIGDKISIRGWVMLKGLNDGERYKVVKINKHNNKEAYVLQKVGSSKKVSHYVDDVDRSIKDKNDLDNNKILKDFMVIQAVKITKRDLLDNLDRFIQYADSYRIKSILPSGESIILVGELPISGEAKKIPYELHVYVKDLSRGRRQWAVQLKTKGQMKFSLFSEDFPSTNMGWTVPLEMVVRDLVQRLKSER